MLSNWVSLAPQFGEGTVRCSLDGLPSAVVCKGGLKEWQYDP
jgi:hypothetical protein